MVSIIGGTGALGLGPAMRMGRAGEASVIDSRDPARAVEAAHRAAGRVPDRRSEGLGEGPAAERS